MTDPSTQTPPAPEAPPAVRRPQFGELAPVFSAASDINPNFLFRSLGGRWIVMMFFGTLGHGPSQTAFNRALARRDLFDDARAQFFGVSYDPADKNERGLKNSLPGMRYFWDFDQAVSRLYGASVPGGYQPSVFLIDRTLRVAMVDTISNTERVLDRLEAYLRDENPAPEYGAPVLTVPRILEPDFCQALIDYYEDRGGAPSGFMRAVAGRTVPMLDDNTKKRRDCTIEDQTLVSGLRYRLNNRLVPMITEAFLWTATRIERYIVACYSAEDGGFFRTHRDNTTPGTAHRRFAVTINLNDDYDGGDLRFPEFGQATHRPPLGGATVFACNLLHEATPVTRGVRYATVPFLYDEAGAAIRQANLGTLVSPEEAGLISKP